MSDDKVVFLTFKNKNINDESLILSACSNCSNKTYIIIYDNESEFPRLQCCACGLNIGRIGWANEED